MKSIESGKKTVKTIDMHTGGEPLRIITEGYPSFDGLSVLDTRKALKEEYDHLRTALMWEPRGHRDMYGALVLPPQRTDSSFGAVFMHNDGYSTMCGHATIALGRAAVDLGWVQSKEGTNRFKMDAPCGQIGLNVVVDRGEVIEISFDNVPSFYVGHFKLSSGAYKGLAYDLAYGGAFYALVVAKDAGLDIHSSRIEDFVRKGKEIKDFVRKEQNVLHPFEEALSFLYGVIFIGPAQHPVRHSRNVCVFAEGEVDRCATGSGVSARSSVLLHRGNVAIGEEIIIESITGSTLTVEVLRTVSYGPYTAVIPRVRGMAYYTGHHTFVMDPSDPFVKGFLLH